MILQNDAGNQSRRYPNTIVLSVSSRGRPIPLHVRVEPSSANGLSVTSWVKCEQILTISKSRLLGDRPLGRLSADEIRDVESSVAEEVVQHLSTLSGTEVEVSLELQIRVPGGVGDDVVRTVTENCNTLKFGSFGFEEE